MSSLLGPSRGTDNRRIEAFAPRDNPHSPAPHRLDFGAKPLILDREIPLTGLCSLGSPAFLVSAVAFLVSAVAFLFGVLARLFSAAAFLFGVPACLFSAAVGSFACLDRVQQAGAGDRIEEPKTVPVAFEVQAQDLAG
jgi:hypothetical protein